MKNFKDIEPMDIIAWSMLAVIIVMYIMLFLGITW